MILEQDRLDGRSIIVFPYFKVQEKGKDSLRGVPDV